MPRPDAKTKRLRSAIEAAGGAWRDALALSEADLAALVRSDGVDILVDLTGHTANNRLGTFAMRPAPIQVNFPSLCTLSQSGGHGDPTSSFLLGVVVIEILPQAPSSGI